MSTLSNLTWTTYEISRPFTIEQIYETLIQLCTTRPRGYVVLETRVENGKIRYSMGVETQYQKTVKSVFKTHLDISFSSKSQGKPIERRPVTVAKRLTVSKPILALNTERVSAVIRQGLAVLSNVPKKDVVVVQIVLGRGYSPSHLSSRPQDPHESWLDLALYGAREASSDSKRAMKEKVEQYNYQTIIRIGAGAGTKHSAVNGILRQLHSALKTIESAGVNIKAVDEEADKLNQVLIPWQINLRLSVKEIAPFLLLPAGEEDLPGVRGLHPREIRVPEWYVSPKEGRNNGRNNDWADTIEKQLRELKSFAGNKPDDKSARIFAKTLDEEAKNLSISPKDALEHTILLGPTGSGKSTAMEHLILSDIKAGRSVLVIDPKADLIVSILERIPEYRKKDVVVIDPSSSAPVGFNPLHIKGYDNNTLIADAILAVFHEIFNDSWGIRTQQILSAALLTLTDIPDSTLLLLSPLLTNADYRRRIVATVKDQIGLLPFWKQFESMKESERTTHIAPVLNKLEQFIFRPSLRNILGQANPKFDLMDLFLKRKIVLVPLNKGLIGSESAKLLGSLMIGLTWTLALKRASIPANKRHMVSLYIDELQDYLKLPTDLADALSQARGLGLSITMAHQYRGQLLPEMRAAIDANARNKIVFGLNGTDAKEMAGFAPELTAEDFMLLPRYHVYANIMDHGRATGWISGITMPPDPKINLPAELVAECSKRYGRDGKETEAEYLKAVYQTDYQSQTNTPSDSDTNTNTDNNANATATNADASTNNTTGKTNRPDDNGGIGRSKR